MISTTDEQQLYARVLVLDKGVIWKDGLSQSGHAPEISLDHHDFAYC